MGVWLNKRWLSALALMVASHGAQALDLLVLTAEGEPLANTVVWVEPEHPVDLESAPDRQYTMDQVRRQFVPHVLPVPRGASVHFPNSDTILHHVYSFSPAKTFELKLYKGDAREPVTFEKPGIVVLGCNIHDWMLGYIVVVDTPYFAKTDSRGRAELSLTPGQYTLSLWHSRIKPRDTPQAQRLDYEGQKNLTVAVTRELAPELGHFYNDELDDY